MNSTRYPYDAERITWLGTLGGRIAEPIASAAIEFATLRSFSTYSPARLLIPIDLQYAVVHEIYDDSEKRAVIDTAHKIGGSLLKGIDGYTLNDFFDFRDYAFKAEAELELKCNEAGIIYTRYYHGPSRIPVNQP